MTLKTDIDQLAVDSALLHSIVNGPASGAGSLVTVEGGLQVNTIAKAIADLGNAANYLSSAGGTLSGALTVNAALSASGNFAINTNKFTVAAASGNTAIAGTLSSGNLTVTGTGSFVADSSAANPLTIKNSAAAYANNNNLIRFTNSANATVGAISHPAATTLGIWGVSGIKFLTDASASTVLGDLTSAGLSLAGASMALQNTTSNGTLTVGAYTGTSSVTDIRAGGSVTVTTYSGAAFSTKLTVSSAGNLTLNVDGNYLQWGAGYAAIQADGSTTSSGANNYLKFYTANSPRLAITAAGHGEAGTDNVLTWGTASKRWATIYAGTGAINTSDAREKTVVIPLAEAEIAASTDMAREIGTYRWLVAIQEKGDAARLHVGLTVQRAIEIMESHGLDPFAYGFICHDAWEEQVVEHPAIEAKGAVLDEDGNEVEPAVEAKAAWTEVVQEAGDRFAFRYDELAMFLARGFDARLTALEAA